MMKNKELFLNFVKAQSEKYNDDIVKKHKLTLYAFSGFFVKNGISINEAGLIIRALVNEDKIKTNIDEEGINPFDAYIIVVKIK